jgi:virginiamycin B lyase
MTGALMTRLVRRALTVAVPLSASLMCVTGVGVTAAQAAPITEFSTGLGAAPLDIQPGPDGNLWFVDTDAIGRITPAGVITEFTNGLLPGSVPHAIAPGGDGNMWFTDDGTTHAIGRITPAGVITEFTTGLLPGSAPYELTPGANGTLWFTDQSAKAIGRIIPSTGTITEFDVSGVDAVPELDEITEGPDGNIDVTDKGNFPGIIKVTPNGTVSEAYTTIAGSTMPSGIGAGNDGNVWFTDTGLIGKSTPAGASTGYTTGLQVGSVPDAITAGPDGNEWFDDQYNAQNAVGRITPTGQIKEFDLTTTPWDITPGIDGNLWLPVGDGVTPSTSAVVRVTPAGVVTSFSAGLNARALFADNTNIVSGPDGNLWTIDNMGTPAAIVRVDVQLPPTVTSGAISALTSSGAVVAGAVNSRGSAATVTVAFGTTPALGSTAAAGSVAAGDTGNPVAASLSGLAPATLYYYRVVATNTYGTVTGATESFTTAAAPSKTTTTTTSTSRILTARVGNQHITVVIPAAQRCVAVTTAMPVHVNSTAIAGATGATLHFRRTALFLDRGMKRIRIIHKRVGTVSKRVKLVVYRANATRHRVPAMVSLRLRGLTSGAHRLRITMTYSETIHRHGRRATVTVTKTLRAAFRVC